MTHRPSRARLRPAPARRRSSSCWSPCRSLVFSLLYLAPGSPEQLLLGNAKTVRPGDDRTRSASEYHLNDPFLVQYGNWAAGALQLDFGTLDRDERAGRPAAISAAARAHARSSAGLAFLHDDAARAAARDPGGDAAAAERRPRRRRSSRRRPERAGVRERDPAALPLRGAARLVPGIRPGRRASPTGCTTSCCPRSRSRSPATGLVVKITRGRVRDRARAGLRHVRASRAGSRRAACCSASCCATRLTPIVTAGGPDPRVHARRLGARRGDVRAARASARCSSTRCSAQDIPMVQGARDPDRRGRRARQPRRRPRSTR